MKEQTNQDITDLVVNGLRHFVDGKSPITKGRSGFNPFNDLKVEIDGKRTLFHSILCEQSTVVIPSELLMFQEDPKTPKLLDAKVWFLSNHIFLQALVDVVQNQGGKLIELEDYSVIANAV